MPYINFIFDRSLLEQVSCTLLYPFYSNVEHVYIFKFV